MKIRRQNKGKTANLVYSTLGGWTDVLLDIGPAVQHYFIECSLSYRVTDPDPV